MRFIEDYCSQHAQQNQEQLSKLFISIDKFYFGQYGNLSQNSAEICSYYVSNQAYIYMFSYIYTCAYTYMSSYI